MKKIGFIFAITALIVGSCKQLSKIETEAVEITFQELDTMRRTHSTDHTVYNGSDSAYHYFSHHKLWESTKKYKLKKQELKLPSEFPLSEKRQPILLLRILLTMQSYELENTLWRMDKPEGMLYKLLGLNTETTCYTMTLRTPENQPKGKIADSFVKFENDNRFVSYYTSWCGNDCFTTVYGQYEAYTDLLIITVDSVTFRGDCHAPTEYRKHETLKFDMIKNDSVINLTLIK